jgi:hypothetical protein
MRIRANKDLAERAMIGEDVCQRVAPELNLNRHS